MYLKRELGDITILKDIQNSFVSVLSSTKIIFNIIFNVEKKYRLCYSLKKYKSVIMENAHFLKKLEKIKHFSNLILNFI